MLALSVLVPDGEAEMVMASSCSWDLIRQHFSLVDLSRAADAGRTVAAPHPDHPIDLGPALQVVLAPDHPVVPAPSFAPDHAPAHSLVVLSTASFLVLSL